MQMKDMKPDHVYFRTDVVLINGNTNYSYRVQSTGSALLVTQVVDGKVYGKCVQEGDRTKTGLWEHEVSSVFDDDKWEEAEW